MSTTEKMKEAKEGFKRVLEEIGEEALVEQTADLNRRLLEKNFTIKGEPFPTFLKPYLVDADLKPMFERSTRVIMDCLEKVGDLFFSDPQYESYFEMDALDLELARIDPGYKRRVINGRLDAFLYDTGEGPQLKFLEFNCDSPCGMGWHDQLIGMLAETPVYRAFDAKFPSSHRDPITPSLLEGLRAKNREFGNPDDATFAVLCWEDSAVRYDLELVTSTFNELGHKAVWADNRWGAFDGTTLTMKGEPVGLVFRDAIQEFTEDMEGTKPVMDAFKAGKICLVNPFSSRVGGLKCILWFLTDPMAAEMFTAEEKEVIRRTIPWTRFMRPGKTDYFGEEVDLFEYVRRERERMVLKPNAGYGGFNVAIGRETGASRWDEILEECTRAPWVVQEFVPIPAEEFPVIRDGKLNFENKNANINFFAHDGKFGGGLVRISDSSIINIHQGGGLVPIGYV